MKIDFDGIQAFVAIAELGGFSKAAEQLHVTQTALTRRVQKLEAYLNLRLLDRTTRYVELTAVGREFLPQARAIVSEMTLAVGRLKDMSKHARGSFTLAASDLDLSRAVVSKYISRLEERLAAISGVAERTLAKHFQAFLGRAPLTYLRQLRLAAARERLLQGAGPAAVTAVATRYGFTHFGRFSAQYRRAFGELPSSTLRQGSGSSWWTLSLSQQYGAILSGGRPLKYCRRLW